MPFRATLLLFVVSRTVVHLFHWKISGPPRGQAEPHSWMIQTTTAVVAARAPALPLTSHLLRWILPFPCRPTLLPSPCSVIPMGCFSGVLNHYVQGSGVPLWDPEKEFVPQFSHLPIGSNSNIYPMNVA